MRRMRRMLKRRRGPRRSSDQGVLRLRIQRQKREIVCSGLVVGTALKPIEGESFYWNLLDMLVEAAAGLDQHYLHSYM